jgi:hypothetical protein
MAGRGGDRITRCVLAQPASNRADRAKTAVRWRDDMTVKLGGIG